MHVVTSFIRLWDHYIIYINFHILFSLYHQLKIAPCCYHKKTTEVVGKHIQISSEIVHSETI